MNRLFLKTKKGQHDGVKLKLTEIIIKKLTFTDFY